MVGRNLMEGLNKLNFGEDDRPVELRREFLNVGDRITVLFRYSVESSVVSTWVHQPLSPDVNYQVQVLEKVCS